MTINQADIGLIGLAVMGQNLTLNMCDHGYRVVVFNRTVSKVDDFLNGEAKGYHVIGAHSLKEFFKSLKRPRKFILMVKAGPAVDAFIEQSLPFLESGDIIIDGGNSLYTDTERRYHELLKKGILFVGAGISGGEEGARKGPSIMPGGHLEAWEKIKDILQSIAAKAEDGKPCCQWIGSGGAGHYVKMVHNGIEYGDMQLICEAFHFLNQGMGIDYEMLYQLFNDWNQKELKSYLIEITAKIFQKKEEDGSYLLDKILDKAGQKGTGKWTAINALELGVPVTLIAESVFARCLSAMKDERVKASKILKGKILQSKAQELKDKANEYIEYVRQALYASKIVSYAQGFMLMRQASEEKGWNLQYGDIAAIWREGCIIRSRFLNDITKAYEKDKGLSNLLLDPFFSNEVEKALESWRLVVSKAFEIGIPMPCMSAGLAFYDGFRSKRLPANLLQAQRDFFGAHTYERVDRPRGEFFHTHW